MNAFYASAVNKDWNVEIVYENRMNKIYSRVSKNASQITAIKRPLYEEIHYKDVLFLV